MSNEWQPIETAPRDGTFIILCGGKRDNYSPIEQENSPVVGRWQKWPNPDSCCWVYAFWDSDWRSEYINPTHWMPLPEPPL